MKRYLPLIPGLFLSCMSAAEAADETTETTQAAPAAASAQSAAGKAKPGETAAAASQPGPVAELEAVEVIATTPIDTGGVERYKLPTPVQEATAEQMREAQAINLPDYLRRLTPSVNVNDVQNNPFQPDVNFRGFSSSPLLGVPQGLAVYFNGIRFNEPFGDTMNWDLIPQGAVDQMTIQAGSNPVYGLNALGGALAIKTKTGFSAPGHHVDVFGGSWGRHSEEITSGWNDGSFGYFVDLRNFQENGWRQFSPTQVQQAFGSFNFHFDRGEVNLTLVGNGNSLTGNGAVPVQLSQTNYEAVFTHPDLTNNNFFMSELDGSYQVAEHVKLTGNVYFRQTLTRNFNGDDSDFEECEDPTFEGLVCEDDGEGEPVIDQNGRFVEESDAVEGAVNNIAQTNQRSYGGSAQAALDYNLFGLPNRFVTGGSANEGTVSFNFNSELAQLLPNRGTRGSGLFVEEARVWLNTNNQLYNWYFTDTLSVTEELAVTIAGGYNLTRIQLHDQLGTDLDGRHSFDRFNPSAGLTYAFRPEVTWFGNYAESNRAPTAVELSCANPEEPCRLPNAFVSDPPLKQVVAKTWETGFRGEFRELWGGRVNWNAGFFHTQNTNDILFITSGNLRGEGYFDNVGQTLRQGLEVGLTGDYEQVRFMLNYTFLDATFQNGFLSASPNNPNAVDGFVPVQAGDYIPGLPQDILKGSVDWAILPELTVGIDMFFNSGQYFRGDEGNLNPKTSPYAVFNLRGEYRYNEHFSMYARIENLFDRHYNSFGTYGNPSEVLGPQFTDPRFVGVGAPIGGWVGVRLSL